MCKNGQRGFTLVEILVSVVLLAVGMVAAWILVGSVARANGFNRHITRATTFAQDKLEELAAEDYDQVVSGQDGSTPFRRVWSVTPQSILATKNVQVTVDWVDPWKSTHQVQVTSMISKRGD